MTYQSNEQREFARSLRTNQTDAEKLLWSRIRKRQLSECRFRRQHPIGPYVVDFECRERATIVELDGGQHNTTAARRHDNERTRYLESHGYRVLRFWNFEVIDDLDAVLEAIALAVADRAPGRPHPSPSPPGGGG